MQIQTPSGNLFGDNGTLWANMSVSKQFFDDRLRVSLSIDNLYDNPGFQMNRTKPLENTTDSNEQSYDSAYETSDVYNERNGHNIYSII